MSFSTSFFAPSSPKSGPGGSHLTGPADGAPPYTSPNEVNSEVASEGTGAGIPAKSPIPPDSLLPAPPSPTETFSSHNQKSGSHQPSPDPRIKREDQDTEMANSLVPEKEPTPSAAKKPAAKKKKGTATTARAPRRARGGKKGVGGRGGKSKKAAASVSASASAEPSSDPHASVDDDEGGAGEESDDDPGPYCICRGPDNHRFMIACDRCEDWFHGDCIGMDKWTGENLVQRYICPNCGENGRYRTRYRKMCALEDCEKPARLYGDPDANTRGLDRPRGLDGKEETASVFCSDKHAQDWWEQMLLSLPSSKGGKGAKAMITADDITQETFMALLNHQPGENGSGPWFLGQEPFGVPSDFWKTVDHKEALTVEERDFLESSAMDRARLSKEITMCEQMIQLLAMTWARRDAAIAVKKATKDVCGYDNRLDTVNHLGSFMMFVATPEAQAAFQSGKLDAPAPKCSGEGGDGVEEQETDSALLGMCTRKKCKTHSTWNALLTKAVRKQVRELTKKVADIEDAEERVRASAAARYKRKLSEKNWVSVVETPDSDDDAMDQD